MTSPGATSLARVTVAAPKRRMDVALPESMLVAELLPHLLRHADAALAEGAELHGGWALRRATGALLEPGRNLAVQGVRDGEILHLVPRRDDWPELAYDDVVEVIAGGARKAGRSWGGATTRRCGLAVGATLLTLGVLTTLLAGPPWTLARWLTLGAAALLTAAGVLLSRAFADAVAGGAVAATAMPYALAGGALLAAPDTGGMPEFGAPSLLLGSALLVVVAAGGYTGVAALHRLFMAGLVAGVLGLLAGQLGIVGLPAGAAAAVTLTVAIGLLPGYPLLAGWLGRLPVPELPTRAEDILRERRLPRRTDVFAAVSRATELLTGILLGVAVATALSIAVLVGRDGSPAAVLLAGCGAVALLLRARLFALPRQRVPLLTGGLAGLAVLVIAAAASGAAAPAFAGTVAAGVVAVGAGLVYSRGAPSPYLGRAADIGEILAILALIPLACAVVGIFGAVRDLFASIGG